MYEVFLLDNSILLFKEAVSLMNIDKLRHIQEDIKYCRACKLHEHYKINVPYEFYPTSRIMVVARDPGKTEIEQLRPLVGEAGQEFNYCLEQAKLDRLLLFITNLSLCRPKGNIFPGHEAIKCCIDRYLKKEIELFNPRIIIALGVEASTTLLERSITISRIRGKAYSHSWRGLGERIIIPTWHPSFLIRNKYNTMKRVKLREELIYDLALAKKILLNTKL